MTKIEKMKVEEIRNLIKTNRRFTVAAILRIFEKQTSQEQASQMTVEDNGVGFSGRDAEFGSSLAKQILAWIRNKQNNIPNRYDFPLSDRQVQYAQRFMAKYAGQIFRFGFSDNSPISRIWEEVQKEQMAA